METLENRITNMSDNQILEIIFNKEEWSEEAHSVALNQAKVRGLNTDVPSKEIEEKKLEVKSNSEEPLELKWKILIAFVPMGLFYFLLHERFVVFGYHRKAAESKRWVIGSVLFWLIAPPAITKLVWMF